VHCHYYSTIFTAMDGAGLAARHFSVHDWNSLAICNVPNTPNAPLCANVRIGFAQVTTEETKAAYATARGIVM